VRCSWLGLKLQHYFPTGLIIIALGLFLSACSHKAVRVAVTSENKTAAAKLFMDGDAAFARKEYYPALIRYLDSTRLNPNDAIVWNRLGITYAQLSYYQEAIAAFQRSTRLNSKYAYPINNLGTAYFGARELKKAERCFRKAISMDAKEASFHMNLGALYFEKKRPEKAMLEWRKGVALNPKVLAGDNVINLSISGENRAPKDKEIIFARIYASMGDAPKAVEHLELAFMNGYTDIIAIRKLPDFDTIRNDEQFISFMKKALVLISQPKEKINSE
jgi:tetratricopeptide (TPR) repeat protein